MIEGGNVVDNMISPLKCNSNDKSTFGVNFPQEQDLETEIVHSVSRKSDTDRIMSYISKATKCYAKETVNVNNQKKAIQREFNSTRGLGDERESVGTRVADRIRAQSAAAASSVKVCKGKGEVSIRSITVYLYDFLILIYAAFLNIVLNLIPFNVSKKKK